MFFLVGHSYLVYVSWIVLSVHIDAMYPNVAMLKIRSSFLLVVCSLTSIGKREPGASLNLPFPGLLSGLLFVLFS